jgi:phenylalanyl-tRNA synthetase alpha chain
MDVDEMLRILEGERERGVSLIGEVGTLEDLRDAEVQLLGRKSPVSKIQRSLGRLEPDERPRVGQVVNEVFDAFRTALSERQRALEEERDRAFAEGDRLDVTLPGRRPPLGGLHVLTQTERLIVDAFVALGYRVLEGPEIETDWYNFEALNIPPDHPARTMQDTLFLDVPGSEHTVLRTQTSPMQIKAMESMDPPLYVVVPGRTFRADTLDATHSPVFHQVEGLAVDEGLSLADMKGTLEAWARSIFGPEQRVRLRPSYFPFVEPGAEVDVSCFNCDGAGCRICGNGWLEIMGAGMVHPRVLEHGGVDPERYTGYAWGMGVERIAMLRHGIPDIRLFFEGDVRFLERFARGAV